MNVVIFSGGNLLDGFFVRDSLKKADFIIAADSGLDAALLFKIFPKVVIGDMDSVDKKILREVQEDNNIKVIVHNKEKDETDTELAINYAIKKGATTISILGGVEGNRLDHVLGNVMLGVHGSQFTVHRSSGIFFINGNQKLWIREGPAKVQIKSKKGDLLSLIPLSKEVTNIQTKNLQYPLKKETLFLGIPRGISNVFLKEKIEVSFKKGLLLFVQTYI